MSGAPKAAVSKALGQPAVGAEPQPSAGTSQGLALGQAGQEALREAWSVSLAELGRFLLVDFSGEGPAGAREETAISWS